MPSISGNMWEASGAATASAIATKGYGLEPPPFRVIISYLSCIVHTITKGEPRPEKFAKNEIGNTVDNFSRRMNLRRLK